MSGIPYEFIQAGGYFGPKFTGVFFFEDVFWRVTIPLVFGDHVPVNTLDSLESMPPAVRHRLITYERKSFLLHWADCIDYSQGIEHMIAVPPSADVVNLAAAAHRDLISAIGDLKQESPNANAMYHSLQATEKILKAFLCGRHGVVPTVLKRDFSHDVGKLITKIQEVDPSSELCSIRPDVFPPYAGKYVASSHSRRELWEAYQTSQFACAAVIRVFSPYNQRSAMPV